MGRRKDRWLCVVCARRRVPFKGCLCWRCTARLPGLPAPHLGHDSTPNDLDALRQEQDGNAVRFVRERLIRGEVRDGAPDR